MTNIAALFDENGARFKDFLAVIDRFAEDFARIGEDRPPEPRWNQVWFPRLDACAAYTMVRTYKPRRIIEIGAGHSTRFLARAIRDGGLETQLTTVDPKPRATIAGLDLTWIEKVVQDAEVPDLSAGDILFVDSSHVSAPGSDVDHLINQILPSLPSGAIVHFHDIFLPDPYPPEWDYRGYNEQGAIATLLAGGAYDVLFACRYVATRLAQDIGQNTIARLPLDPAAFENSLWLKKR